MRRDEASSLVWLGLAIVICIGSWGLSFGSFQNPGPGFFPFIVGLVAALLAAHVHWQARKASRAAGEGKPAPVWGNPGGAKKIILITAALLIYGISMEHLGFLISTFLFLAFLLRSIEHQGWGLVFLESFLASGLAYLLFEIWLQAQLPKGFLS